MPEREVYSIYIRPLRPEDAGELLDLRIRNRTFLRPFEPVQPESHFTLEAQRDIVEGVIKGWEQDTAYGFGIFLEKTGQLAGRVSLSNVARGAWQNCTIGYFLDQALNGCGVMTEAVRLAVKYAFEIAKLHRVQAAIMPHNEASIRVVEKNGFQYEGLAKYYLNINGKWEDHKIYSITKESFDRRDE